MDGVGALVQLAAYVGNELEMEILFIGRAAFDRKESCTLEAAGRWILYTIVVNGSWVTTKLSLLDRPEPPETVLIAADGDLGWKRTFSVIRALEREEVKSLEKPISFGGGSGPNGYVIGQVEQNPRAIQRASRSEAKHQERSDTPRSDQETIGPTAC